MADTYHARTPTYGETEKTGTFGFFGMVIGLIMAFCLAVGLVPIAEIRQVALIWLVFVVPIELVTAVLAFARRETVNLTVYSFSFVAWLSVSLFCLAIFKQ